MTPAILEPPEKEYVCVCVWGGGGGLKEGSWASIPNAFHRQGL